MSSEDNSSSTPPSQQGVLTKILNFIEWAGNKLPDPALLFVWALLITWVLSAIFAQMEFTESDPRTMVKGKEPSPIVIQNQMTGNAILTFLEKMVTTFTGFHPLGVVLVAMLGVGVAEHTGFINALLKAMLRFTPQMLLSPMLLVVAIVSHTAGDTGYVLVIPLGGVIFAAAGRHPVAGIVCAFAGVSGGFSANFVISALDPLLQGFTQSSAQIVNPSITVNPLCNYIFMASSCLLIVLVGWFLTDRVVENQLKHIPVDGDPEEMPEMGELDAQETRGMFAGLATLVVGLAIVALVAIFAPAPENPSQPTVQDRLISSIVPLIFFLFLVPGVVHGYVAGTVKNHRDVIKGMSKSMNTMGYYLVLAFCAAQFIYAFSNSNLGILLAVKGANFIESLGLPSGITIIAIILLTAVINLLIGSASAKWALISPIFVPMLMQLGLSPELTQAAYRIGDSSTNIITPLMPYFPLIVVYAQRYVKNTGIGTLISLMLPYSICFLIVWTLWLMLFWALGLPLGFPTDVGYTYGA